MSTSSNISTPCHLCQGCGRRELGGDASRIPRTGRLRRFGSACQTLMRRASTRLARNLRSRLPDDRRLDARPDDDLQSPQVGTADNPVELPLDNEWHVYELCATDPEIHELSAQEQEIHEIGGVEEVQGLLAGVRYLDIMSEQAELRARRTDTARPDLRLVIPQSRPSAVVSEATFTPPPGWTSVETTDFCPSKHLDFTNLKTFQYLDEAISLTRPTGSAFPTRLRRSGAIYSKRTTVSTTTSGSSISPKKPTLGTAATVSTSATGEIVFDTENTTCNDPANLDGVFSELGSKTLPPVNPPKRSERTGNQSRSPSAEPAPERPEHRRPRNNQWITLWKLRHDLRELYSKLMAATQNSSIPRASKVRRLFKDATHMLQVGLSTFLEVLKGTVPTTLQKILAFVFVSTVMWTTVNRHKSDLGDGCGHNPLSGINVWRSAIHDTKDRVVLDRVIDALWPSEPSSSDPTEELSQADGSAGSFELAMDWNPTDNADLDGPDASLFTFLDTNRSDGNFNLAQASLFDHSGDQFGSSERHVDAESLLPNFQSEVGHLLMETSNHEDINFAAFLNIPGLEDILPPSPGPLGPGPQSAEQYYSQEDFAPDRATPEPVGALVGPSNMREPWSWENLSIDPHWLSASWASPMQLSDDTTGGSQPGRSLDTSCKSSANGEVTAGRVLVSCLVGTLMFQTVVIFLRYLGGTGSILNILSGCSEAKVEPLGDSQLESSSSSPGYPLEVMGDFFAELSRHVIEPLRAAFEGGHSQLLGLLAMAESMAKCGTIRTLRAFEDYLIHTGLHLSSCRKGYTFLVKSILAQCLRCSSTMAWDHVYGDDVLENEEYSAQYVSTRECRVEDIADGIFVASAMVDTGCPDQLKDDAGGGEIPPVVNQARSSTPSASPPGTSLASSAPRKIARCPHQGCTKEYKGVDARVNLRRHIRCAHESGSAKAFTCPGVGCDLQTPRRDYLRNHFLKKHHGEEMPAWLMDKKRSRAVKTR